MGSRDMPIMGRYQEAKRKGTYNPEQPFADMDWVMQLRRQGERPAVEVGIAPEALDDCACTPAKAATTERTERVVNFIVS